jgi:hypothetical protein
LDLRQGIKKVYQQQEYLDKRKRALILWGAHVMQIAGEKVEGSNVVHLRGDGR